MREISFDRISRTNSMENLGSIVESECLGQPSLFKYGPMVYDTLEGDEKMEELKKQKISEDAYAQRAMLLNQYRKEKYSTKEAIRDSYLKYNQAVSLVEKCQPGDPESPTREFARTLYQKLLKELNFKHGEKLKYFTAVNSHLDINHGVDAFFKVYNKEERELAMATIDVTEQTKKDAYKADLVILVDTNDRQANLDQAAESLAEIIKEKIKIKK